MEVLTSDDGLRSVFALLSVSLVLTIYEILLFFLVISPSVQIKIDAQLADVSFLKSNSATRFLSRNFNVFNKRESILIDKINMYTKITGALIIFSLVFILYIIYKTLGERKQSVGECTLVNIFITLVFISIFQYSFYIYGQKYKYLGSNGAEELISFLLFKLHSKSTKPLSPSPPPPPPLPQIPLQYTQQLVSSDSFIKEKFPPRIY
jgi:hypothetical protein